MNLACCRLSPRSIPDLLHAAPRCLTCWFNQVPFSHARRTCAGWKAVAPRRMQNTAAGHGNFENVITIPNALCLTRILLSPVVCYEISSGFYLLTSATVAFAGFTDLLDGWIARRYPSQHSVFGTGFDPLADKIFATSLFLSLTYYGLIPVELAALVIARDALLVLAAFWWRYKTLPGPKTVSRFFNPALPSAQVYPTFISKVNTAVQLVLVATTLIGAAYGEPQHLLIQYLWYVTAVTTVASGASYAFSKGTFRIVNR